MKILHSIIYSGIIIILKNTETKLEILLGQLRNNLKGTILEEHWSWRASQSHCWCSSEPEVRGEGGFAIDMHRNKAKTHPRQTSNVIKTL